MSASPADGIYLDYNATTPIRSEVLDEIVRVSTEAYANPGSRHRFGRGARREMESARELIADILNADPEEVIFTSGGTESSNLAIRNACGGTPGTILLPEGEHPATEETCLRLRASGWKLHRLPLDENGLLSEPVLEDVPWKDVRLATVLMAHNETGVVQRTDALADRCLREGVPLHLDGVQAVGKIPVDFHATSAMTLSLGAHKFHGPRGIGALLVRDGFRVGAMQFGGRQESNLRPGTEPVPLIAGMAKSLSLWHVDQERLTLQICERRDRLEQRLLAEVPDAVVHGAAAERLPNTCNIGFPGLSGEALLIALDLEGVACSLGSTCASGSTEPATSLLAMGVPRDLALASIRLSIGRETTEDEISEAARIITRVVKRLRLDAPV